MNLLLPALNKGEEVALRRVGPLRYVKVLVYFTQVFGDNLSNSDLKTVAKVELERYLGKWYEIARLPASFQNGCDKTTATYSLLDNGKISVLNECTKNGKYKKAKGTAKVVDKQTGAKLKVTFFWPFYGDYWVIKLGTNYDYAVVGTPSRKYLWILCRTPQMDQKLYGELTEFAKSKGFNTDNLIRTIQ